MGTNEPVKVSSSSISINLSWFVTTFITLLVIVIGAWIQINIRVAQLETEVNENKEFKIAISNDLKDVNRSIQQLYIEITKITAKEDKNGNSNR